MSNRGYSSLGKSTNNLHTAIMVNRTKMKASPAMCPIKNPDKQITPTLKHNWVKNTSTKNHSVLNKVLFHWESRSEVLYWKDFQISDVPNSILGFFSHLLRFWLKFDTRVSLAILFTHSSSLIHSLSSQFWVVAILEFQIHPVRHRRLDFPLKSEFGRENFTYCEPSHHHGPVETRRHAKVSMNLLLRQMEWNTAFCVKLRPEMSTVTFLENKSVCIENAGVSLVMHLLLTTSRSTGT